MADSNDAGRTHLRDASRLELARGVTSVDASSGKMLRIEPARQRASADGTTDGAFDRIARLAVQLFDVPVAIVSIEADSLDAQDRDAWTSVTCAPGVSVAESAQRDPRSLVDPLVAAACGLRFYAAVPLKHRNGDRLGKLCLLDRRSRTMLPEQEAILASLAEMVVDHVEFQARASKKISAERALHQHEHLVATTLQTSMLPKAFPVIDGVRFDAVYVPAGSESVIGGDWYDAYRVSEDHLLLSIGDVAGHGVPAAALTGFLRHSLRAFALTERSPAALLNGLDTLLRSEHDDIFVTSLIVMVDLRTRALRYANAGHPPALVRRTDGLVIELGGTGLPLGMSSEDDRAESVADLSSNALLVLYTDGLTEATRNVLEGEKRLKQALAAPTFSSLREPAHALGRQLLLGGNSDDVAIMSVLFE